MPVWFWLGIAAATVVALAVFGSAALIATLRNIGREVTELLELEPASVARAAQTRMRPAVRA